MKNIFWNLIILLIIAACNEKGDERQQFELLNEKETGVNFINKLEYDEEFNVYTYRNYYNGGGVAIGDINNDGLVDIYLTANLLSNKLYLNQGDFKFKDITLSAAVAGEMGWSTGVSMADVNGDGWLDIYVCNSGDIQGDKKTNELFINNKDNTFTESAKEYNLDDTGYGTHASFFDYDKDGDLDVYLLNNSYQAIGSFNLERSERGIRDSLGGDKLLRNDGNTFIDVSDEAGIYGSVIGFGLGVTVGDLNKDGWEDIYVSNDFFERDYLYYNNQDGTFTESLISSMNSISGASMGADMADINNDGYSDIFVTEMLPGNYERLKSVTTFENYDKYRYNVKNGYFHQFTRNTFQLNNANKSFSEIGRLSGVEASDWSWGALIFDMNNDGLKDLYIANGIYQDLTNQDYLNYISNDEVIKSIVTDNKVNYKKLIDIIPSNPISNKAYLNGGDLNFKDITEEYNLDSASFSNGSAYGDLDNDGDLDLVVNNVNMPSFIYRNNERELNPQKSNYITLELKGSGENTFAIGTQVSVNQNGIDYYLEQQPTRGFQSSVDHRMFFGLPEATPVDISLRWPTGKRTFLKEVRVNQLVEIKEENSDFESLSETSVEGADQLFTIKESSIKHKESQYVDFNRDRLKYHMQSTEGPGIAIGNIDNLGSEDMYISGSGGNSGYILYDLNGQQRKDSLSEVGSEDIKAVLFDADGDGDDDLYIATGSSEFSSSSSLLNDKYYKNEDGQFILQEGMYPVFGQYVNSSAVVPIDYDNDGDLDLFVTERMKQFQYGKPASGYLLNNNEGNLKLDENTSKPFSEIGMITDAIKSDYDNDGDDDIIIVGEYMSIEFYKNENGSFTKASVGLDKLQGWWNTIHAVDIDGDGDQDYIVGNHGLNSRFKASEENPLVLVSDDFDKNGFIDPILTKSGEGGKLFPYALRHDLAQQLKFILKKYPDYESFKKADLKQILGDKRFENADKYKVFELGSVMLINNGEKGFEVKRLPTKAQISPVYAIASHDFDGDGDMDLIVGGNLYAVKPEVGRYDASYGLYLENDGTGNFKTYSDNKGFLVNGEIRDMEVFGNSVWVSRNDDTLLEVSFNEK